MPTIHKIAELLGGEVSGNQVSAPGPGHSADDLSLSVLLDANAPEGFVIHSFADDDAIACRDYVRDRLGLPPFEATKKKANGKWSPPLAEFVYRNERGEPYLLVRKHLDGDGRKQFPQFHWNGTQWLKDKPVGPKIPYRLPELLAAPTAVVYFCEGEKDADALANQACLVATTMSEGASAKWARELTPYFKDRRVVILPDADAPGRKHGQKVAKGLYDVAASIKIVDLYPDRSDGHDVSDWLKHDAVAAKLFKAVEAAPEWQLEAASEPSATATAEDAALLAELAALPPFDYAKRRKRAATKLGISVSDLDRFVAEQRAEMAIEGMEMLYDHWQVLPWDEAVEGKLLFRALSECIRRYVILTEPQATTVALWVVYSWLHEHERFATHSPVLLVRSAEKDSGKTTLLGIITFLTRRALNSVEISGAALFRSIAKWAPTFVIDEGDDVLVDNGDLRSVVNSGWTRGQTVIRCHHDTHEPESFSTFAPKVLGMKGDKLPDTTLSRALAIDMKPKLAGEWIADFDHLDNETFARLRRQILRWAADNAEALASRQPEIPQDFHNRRRANWRPLLAIAEQMEMKQAGWDAALAIEQRQITADPSTGIQLLTAIRFIFDEMVAGRLVLGQADKDRLMTVRLIQELIDIPESPWATYGKNEKPITAAQVTKLLKPYGIKSGSVRIPKEGETTPKGYLRAWFEDAFKRYLPPATEAETRSDFSAAQSRGGLPDTPDTTLITKDFSSKSNPTQAPFVAGPNSSQPVEYIDRVGCVGFEGRFSGTGRKERSPSTEDNQPDDIPTDRTCVQCRGEIDGTERLVAVSGRAVWLHAVCERFWLKQP
ncbi:DUF3631 domain-containing protein [Bradyrhizobium rifense]|uniref:DUF3631 domain-containing protein n=1 Tax=Bradyrhizobium rifense TaxID=515499 RepID=UPI001652E0C7|nr:DUF3631 domain-containing protein [Bradyrhizobium rifense]